MRGVNARSAILAAALLLCGVEPVPCAAQSPAAPPSVAAPSRPAPAAAPPARPAAAPTAAPRGGPSTEALPSTVSPAIARFMQGAGRNLPPPPPLAVPTAARSRPTAAPARSAVPPATAASPEPRIRLQVPASTPPAPVRGENPPAPGAATAPTGPTSSFGLSSLGPAPAEIAMRLKPTPTDPSDLRFPINLATALRLADARPLVVAMAQAGAWIAEAQLTYAKVLWVPSLNIGFDYIRHDGGGPDFNKGIMTAPSVNYFMAGAGANLFINTTDAYFEPLVARQVLNAAHWDIQSAKNDVLLQTTDAYFRVHQYRGMYAGSLYVVERGRDLVERIANLSRELVPTVEVERARNMLAELEQRAVMARQQWRVASADLTQVLRLDPRAVVVPLEHDHVQLTLIDPGRGLDDLMSIALHNRPELASRRAQISAAEIRVQREKMRPLLPLVMINGFQHAAMYLQAGIFALGPNSSLNQWRGRENVSLQLMWQLEGMGLGNLARIKARRGDESRTIIDLRRNQDMVAADVTRAHARAQSAAARVLQADRALRTGIITFNGHLEGLEQTRRLGNVLVLTFRPQEAVYSLDMLNVAFDEYFTTVAEYNRAQFDLFHAIGYPASEIAVTRPVGEVLPVDTSRPGYLPRVGNGPPPATR